MYTLVGVFDQQAQNARLHGTGRIYPQFFTATIYEWKHLLRPDKYKLVVTNSLKYLEEDKRVKVYPFTIMSNHLHIIWQMLGSVKREAVQRDFLKFTS